MKRVVLVQASVVLVSIWWANALAGDVIAVAGWTIALLAAGKAIVASAAALASATDNVLKAFALAAKVITDVDRLASLRMALARQRTLVVFCRERENRVIAKRRSVVVNTKVIGGAFGDKLLGHVDGCIFENGWTDGRGRRGQDVVKPNVLAILAKLKSQVLKVCVAERFTIRMELDDSAAAAN